ncbi:MAG TPA: penicillin-binding transpeptidase domain-containing protein [Bryobacteraceae bacterium]|nr:penicillin-binding transpeptidase domain-containing protein [Bryobacteraceae bacterium]
MIDLRFLSRAVSSLAVLSLGLCLSAPAAKPAAAAVANKKPAARAALRKRAAGSGHAALLKTRATPRLRTGVSRSRTSAALIHSKVARPGAIRGKAIRPTGVVATRRARRALWSPWTEPTYADSVVGDNIEGDDLVVRQAAAEALGPYNGTIVVADLETGRVLSIVNQKLGLKGAFQPCSTVKVVVSFASLNEGLIEPDTKVRLSRRTSLDLTGALAHSNNLYFAKMGESLGFDRFEKYAKLFGLGEKAGLDIAGEEAGTLATETPRSGMGMMTSFGDGIRLTPLQLSSIVGTVANGGTMYYLQYPKTPDEIQKFVPRIKRQLDIARFVPQVRPGMMGAVEYGTARRAVYDESDPVLGKTGTCTDTLNPGVHLGWFGSFNDLGKNKVSVVVLLTGGRGVGGSVAAGIAGNVYRNLTRLHYFGADQTIANQGTQSTTPTKLVSMENTARP